MSDVKPFICPNCGHFAETVKCASHDREKPRPGDITVCVACGAVNKFADNFEVLSVTAADWDTLPETLREFVARALHMRSALIGDYLKRKENEQARQ